MITLEEIQGKLKTHLRPASVPSADDAWHDLQNALGRQELRHRMPTMALKVALALAVLLITTMGMALAASPHLREQIETVIVGITGGRSGISTVQPTPAFQVFQPTFLPEGMQLWATGYNPGPGSDTKPRWVVVGGAVRVEGRSLPDPIVEATRQRAAHLLSESSDPTLVLIYGAGQDKVVELVQRAAGGRPLPEGTSATVHQEPAVFSQRDGRDLLVWVEQGTYVEMHSSLERADTLRVAEGLRKTDLTALQPGLAPPQPVTGTPPAWVRTLLAQRLDSVQRPTVSQEAIVQQCGRWNDARTTYGAQSFDQAVCAARVAAGVGGAGNSGVDRSRWLDLAQRLKLDPSFVSDGNRLVWLVQLNISDAGGYLVVLDVETGVPYLIATLKPIDG